MEMTQETGEPERITEMVGQTAEAIAFLAVDEVEPGKRAAESGLAIILQSSNHGNGINTLDSLHEPRYSHVMSIAYNSSLHASNHSFHRGASKVPIMSSDGAPAITQVSTAGILASSRTRSLRVQVALAFFAIYIIWGSTYLAIRYAVETIPPLYTAGFRHLVAGSILLLWCFWKKLRPTRAQLRASVIIGALFFLGGHGALHWAEQRINSGLASLLIATEPIFVFVLAAAAEKRWRMNARLLTGIALGLAGVALLFGKNSLIAGPGMTTAAAVTLLGALSWALGIVYSRKSHLSGHPLLLSALSLISGALLLLLAGTVTGEGRGFHVAAVSHRSWMALGYLILFGSVIAFTAYNWLLEHYSPTLVATHTYVNPIVAVLLGWLLANERVTLNVAMAGAMVIGAVVLVDRGTARLQSQTEAGATDIRS